MPEGWQDIASAPQDGRHLVVGRFVGVRLDWLNIAWRDPKSSRMWKMRGGYCDPTHWIDVPTTRELPKRGHYGAMCMNPDLCAGKGYCPRDPTCAD